MAENATKCRAADAVTQTFSFGHGTPIMVRAVDFNALYAECQKLRKDAERYRFLRDYARHGGLFIGTYDVKGAGPERFACLSMDMADAAVDAAMAATPAVGAA